MTEEAKRKRGRPPGSGLNGRRRSLTVEESERFRAAAKKAGKRWDLFFALTTFFAMRVGEAVRLKMSDLNLPARQLTIRPEKMGVLRTYDLPEPIVVKLRAWMREREADPDMRLSPYLFPHRMNRRTEPMPPISAASAFRRIARAASISSVHSVHDLRTTTATRLAALGKGLPQIAFLLRHKSAISSQRYVDASAGEGVEREMAARPDLFM